MLCSPLRLGITIQCLDMSIAMDTSTSLGVTGAGSYQPHPGGTLIALLMRSLMNVREIDVPKPTESMIC